MIESRALDGTTCWQCKTSYSVAVNLRTTHPMSKGDITLCPNCGAVSIVDERDGVLFQRPPDITGPDRGLTEDRDLMEFLISRMLRSCGIIPRQCPRCDTVAHLTGDNDRGPRYGDVVDCDCGAELVIQADLSLGLKEEGQ